MTAFILVAAALLAQPATRPTLAGTVVDAKGEPVAGARVDVSTAAPKVGPGVFCPSCYLDCAKSVRTDPQGRFLIAGLDPALKFRILVSAPGKRSQLTPLTDPLAGPLAVALADLPKDVPAERLLLGEVVDEQGLPIEGALVDPAGAKTADRRWWGTVDVEPAVTDNDGRFTLFLPPTYQGLDLSITADGHAGIQFELLAPGATRHRLAVPTGTRVVGRLVFGPLPMSGIQIAVVQMDRSAGRHFIKAVAATTDLDGRFDMNYLPADEDYAIFSVAGEGPQPLVLTTKKFKAFASGKERDLGDLKLIASLRLAGRVELPEGTILPPHAKIVLSRDPAWDLISAPLAADGRFEFSGLPPETYAVRVTVGGLRLNGDKLPYQRVDAQSFGIRLRESLTDLRIPMEIAR